MALLTILTAPDPRLTRVAKPVPKVDEAVQKLMDDMLETMYANDGIGLAATQVGVAQRVIVIDTNFGQDDLPPNPIKMANPELIWMAEKHATREEGCLSVPEHSAEIDRPEAITVRYLDETNTPQEQQAEGLLATCIQHEIDHLDGILFIDHLSRLKRDIAYRRLKKLKASEVV